MRLKFNVKSSAIARVVYNSKTKEMRIAFQSNPAKEYEFYNVPTKIVSGLLKAESAGRYYHANIRGRYSEKEESKCIYMRDI